MSIERITQLTVELAKLDEAMAEIKKQREAVIKELWENVPEQFVSQPAHMREHQLIGASCSTTVQWRVASTLDIKRVRAEASIEQLRSWEIDRSSRHFFPMFGGNHAAA